MPHQRALPALRDCREVAPQGKAVPPVLRPYAQSRLPKRALELLLRHRRRTELGEEWHVAIARLTLRARHMHASVLDGPLPGEELVRQHARAAQSPPDAADAGA